MIDYQVLCQTIAEWKAGQRPSPGSSGAYEQVSANPEEVEEMESGLVVMEDSELTYEEMPAEEGGYEQEGEVTYGDEQAAEYVEEAAPEAAGEPGDGAEPEYEEAAEEIAVDTDDDDEEIPVD